MPQRISIRDLELQVIALNDLKGVPSKVYTNEKYAYHLLNELTHTDDAIVLAVWAIKDLIKDKLP